MQRHYEPVHFVLAIPGAGLGTPVSWMNHTTGVVLTPEIQPSWTSPGSWHCQWDWWFCPFLPPQPKPGPYFTARYAGTMEIKWLAQGYNSKSQARTRTSNPRIGSQTASTQLLCRHWLLSVCTYNLQQEGNMHLTATTTTTTTKRYS